MPERAALLKQVRQGTKLRNMKEHNEILEKKAKKPSSKGGGQQEKNEDLMADLSKALQKRRAGVNGKQGSDVQQPSNLDRAFSKMSAMIPPPRSRSSSVSSDSGNIFDDEDWDTSSEPIEQASSGSQSLHRERSGSLDSGIGSGSEPTSPLHSVPKAGKPPIPPKPANLQTKPEAPLVNKESDVSSVNSKVQNLSVKDRCGVFGEMATKFERELLVR